MYRIQVDIKEGRNLVAKDRNLLGLGLRTTSDPYVELYFGSRLIGKTSVIDKTLNPVWEDASFNWIVGSGTLDRKRSVELRIWDKDVLSTDDPMGNVFIPFPEDMPCRFEKWYPINTGVGKYTCLNATGDMLVAIRISGVRLSSVDGPLPQSSSFTLRSSKGDNKKV